MRKVLVNLTTPLTVTGTTNEYGWANGFDKNNYLKQAEECICLVAIILYKALIILTVRSLTPTS